jgi:hypothetical protein
MVVAVRLCDAVLLTVLWVVTMTNHTHQQSPHLQVDEENNKTNDSKYCKLKTQVGC